MTLHDPLDEFLATAMQARPEHLPAINIAAVALTRADTANAHFAKLAKLARWTRLASAAAILLVALTLAAGYMFWPTTTTSAATYADTTTTTTLDPTTLGIAAFLLAVITLTTLAVLTPDRPTYRLTLA